MQVRLMVRAKKNFRALVAASQMMAVTRLVICLALAASVVKALQAMAQRKIF